jgi:hypothetical protein
MTDPAILARLEKLERESRLLKLAGLLLLVVVAGVGAAQKPEDALAPKPLVTVQKLVLVDAQGNHRAMLGSDKEGAYLVFQGMGTAVRVGLFGTDPHLDTTDPRTGSWENRLAGRVIPVR